MLTLSTFPNGHSCTCHPSTSYDNDCTFWITTVFRHQTMIRLAKRLLCFSLPLSSYQHFTHKQGSRSDSQPSPSSSHRPRFGNKMKDDDLQPYLMPPYVLHVSSPLLPRYSSQHCTVLQLELRCHIRQTT